MSSQDTLIVEPKKRSHNVKNSQFLRELGQDKVYAIYEYLDWLWEVSGFVPCPIKQVAEKFQTTATHVTYVMLAWRESRMKREIYGQSPAPQHQ